MAGQTIAISVLADTAPFAKAMKGVGIGVGAALATVAAGVVALGASAFKAVAEVERLNAQTAAAIKSTGGLAGRSIDQINGLADSLERMSGIEAESIQAGQNLLLTFTNIRGVNFDNATKAALDMSVAMGTDMTSAATLVGKALNDPIKGIGALSKVGVQLTDSQKATIAEMVKLGDTAGAQGVILAELNTQFGGSAEAFGGTFLGTVEKVKNSLGALTESMVAGLLPGATAVLGGLNALLLGVAASPAFATLVEGVNGFVLALFSGDSAVGAFIAQAVQLVTAFSPLSIVLQAVAPLLPQLAALFTQLGSVIGGAVVSILPTVVNLANTLATVLSGALAAVLPVVASLVTTLVGVLATLIPVIAPVAQLLAGHLNEAITQLAPVIGNIAAVIGGVLGTVLQALSPLLTLVASAFVQVLGAVMPIVSAILPLVSAVLTLIEPIAMLIGAILPPLVQLFTALLTPILALIAPLLGALTPAIQVVAGVLGGIIGIISGVISWFVQLITGSRTASQGFTAAFSGVGAFFANLVGSIVGFFNELPGRILGIFAGAGRWLYDVGRNIIDGLINGAGSLLRNLGGFFLNLVPDFIKGPFKAALGIRSPSRVFAGYGLNIVQGLANGIGKTSTLDAAMSRLSSSVTSGFAPAAALGATTLVSDARASASSSSKPDAVIAHLAIEDRKLLTDIRAAIDAGLTISERTITGATNAGNVGSTLRSAG